MAAGSRPTCGHSVRLASPTGGGTAAGPSADGGEGEPKARRTLSAPNLPPSRHTSPVVLDGARDNQTHYAVDATGGGRNSAMSLANRVLEMLQPSSDLDDQVAARAVRP